LAGTRNWRRHVIQLKLFGAANCVNENCFHRNSVPEERGLSARPLPALR
jgi:hypothetical protein